MNINEIKALKKEGWTIIENTPSHISCIFDVPKEIILKCKKANKYPGYLSKGTLLIGGTDDKDGTDNRTSRGRIDLKQSH